MSLAAVLWGVLAAYGVAMFAMSPTARSLAEFFQGRARSGREVGLGLLAGSVVISWIFSKSITNAANLGDAYGFVGAAAYAAWYLSIPVAGVVLYGIRRRTGASSVAAFLTSRYGRSAAAVFMLVVTLRLLNEVWSNTAVVGAYFGAPGTGTYDLAALAFTGVTLAYSLRGGLRSSILTDAVQLAVALGLLVLVLVWIVPRHGSAALLESGHWTLHGGVDLVLVGLIQSFSYPFHDPVLTDRAFITGARKMLVGYVLAGLVAGAFIALFGLVGVSARLTGLTVHQDAPLAVARGLGLAAVVVTTVMMMVSAGSTLDSTLSSVSRAAAVDLADAGWLGRLARMDRVRLGRLAMGVAVVVGSLPLFAGAAILKATTVSGTMVLGLAPIFLLWRAGRPGPFAFHLAFWPGVAFGLAFALGAVPAALSVGGGPNAALLGVNLWGSAAALAGFALGATLDARRAPAPGISRG